MSGLPLCARPGCGHDSAMHYSRGQDPDATPCWDRARHCDSCECQCTCREWVEPKREKPSRTEGAP